MKRVALFPGQGSQSVGMLAEISELSSVIQHTFSQASESLGYDVWALCQQDSDNQLNQTEFTQPALLTASVALWRFMQERKMTVDYMAGHSLGEYSALVCANALTLEDAVTLVQKRGQLMQNAVPAGTGAMAAVLGLDDATVESVCQQIEGDVWPANYNAAGQVVIAGAAAAVDAAIEACKSAGAKRAVLLPVSVPSHCPLMEVAASQFAEILDGVSIDTPEVPILHNVDASLAGEPSDIVQKLKQQLYRPVRWATINAWLKAADVKQVYEVGPGKVLTGLYKRVDKEAELIALDNPSSW